MSPHSNLGSVRPAAVLREEIRALIAETGTWLWGPARERYEALRADFSLS